MMCLGYSDFMSEIILGLIESHMEDNNLLHLFDKKIVDICCGSGRILHLIKQKHPLAIVTGVDISPTKEYDDVTYLTEDIKHTSIPSSSIDLVISNNILDNFNRGEHYDIFEEVDRILVPNGIYALSECGGDALAKIFCQNGYSKMSLLLQKRD